MAFYGERFRRPDEEDIWEELKQMLLNPPSEQEIALKKQQEQAWIDSILNKAFPENPNAQTGQTLKTNNSSISPMGTSNQNILEGFGQNSINGFTNKKKQNEFPDLGKSTDFKNESFAPIYDEEEMLKNYLVDPNQNIVIDEIEGPFIEKKKEPKYEIEEPVDYEEMTDEEEDTTSEELETSEETEDENPKEKSEETSSELQDEPYLRYEDLLPDETNEEREEREARELEAFNKAWDKANGVEEKVFTKPSQETLRATIIKDDIYTPYNDEIEKNPNLTEEEKVAKRLEVLDIQKAAKAREKEINIDNIKGQAKIYGKEILPYAIPEALPAKMVTSTSKLLKPLIEKPLLKFGNKIKGKLSESLAKTTIASPIESSLEALDEKRNPVKTVLKNYPKDIVEGAVLGIFDVNLDKSKTMDSIRKSTEKWNIRQQRKQLEKSVQYYDDYVKGTSKDIGLEEWLEEILRKRRK